MRLQRLSWFLFLVLFLSAAVLSAWGYDAAERVAFWGVVVILTLTVAKLLLLAEQFRTARLYRCSLLSYLLVFILISLLMMRMYVIP
jgi:hypothetical protein